MSSVTALTHIVEAMAIVSAIQLFATLCFIIIIEPPFRGANAIWKTFKRPVNIAILVGGFSLFGYYASMSSSLRLYGAIQGTHMDSVTIFFLATAELAYLHYTWSRSKSIVEMTFPRYTQTLTIALQLSPLLLYTQAILTALSSEQIISADLSITLCTLYICLVGLAIILFDTIMILSFLKFLRKTQIVGSLQQSFSGNNINYSTSRNSLTMSTSTKTNQNSTSIPATATTTTAAAAAPAPATTHHDPQFKLICRYGIASTSTCLLTDILYGLTLLFPPPLPPTQDPKASPKESETGQTTSITASSSATSMSINMILTVIVACFLNLVFTILLAMKLAIHVQEMRRKRASESQLEKTLGRDQLALIRRGSMAKNGYGGGGGGGGGNSSVRRISDEFSIGNPVGGGGGVGAGAGGSGIGGLSAGQVPSDVPSPTQHLSGSRASHRSLANLARRQSMVFNSQRDLTVGHYNMPRPQSMVFPSVQRDLVLHNMSDHALPMPRLNLVKGEFTQ